MLVLNGQVHVVYRVIDLCPGCMDELHVAVAFFSVSSIIKCGLHLRNNIYTCH